MGKMVFLSHSSADDKVVQRYADALKAEGISCWLDHEDGIRPGVSYAQGIMDGINNSLLFLLFYSCNVKNRPFDVLNEIEVAKGKAIIPVLLDNAGYSVDFEYYLKRFQWINVANQKDDEAIGKVIGEVRQKLAKELESVMSMATALCSKQKYEQAACMYQRCAESGNADAQNCLGWMYSLGKGVERNYEKAVSLWQEAANQGHANAQYNLGLMYDKGYGVELNKSEAFKWFLAAARHGDPDAQCCIGEMFNDGGDHVVKNYVKAVKWFQAAANQGHVRAQFDLGQMLERGRGAKKSMSEALKWYRRAATGGYEAAKKRLEEIETSFSYIMGRVLRKLFWFLRLATIVCAILGLGVVGVILWVLFA